MHTSSWCWKGIAFENPTSWELCTCTELSGSKRDRTVVSIRAFPVFPCVSHLGNMKSGSRFSWRAVKSLVFCKASHSAAVSKSLAERTDRSDRINLPTCLCKVQPGSTGSTRINQVQNNLDPAQQVARPLLAVLSLALLRCSIWTWDFCDNCRDCDKKTSQERPSSSPWFSWILSNGILRIFRVWSPCSRLPYLLRSLLT